MANILISGTGMIGTHLSEILDNNHHRVSFLSRDKTDIDNGIYNWNPKGGYIDSRAFQDVDTIIHLAGESIGGGRWSKSRKKQILSSRVETANLIYKEVLKNNIDIKHYITASAVGYYGAITSDKIFSEEDEHYEDFLGATCYEWEKSTEQFERIGIRTTKIRIGVVLSSHGGAMSKMLMPIKIGLGSPFGSGNQYMPWIHIEDLSNIFYYVIQNQLYDTFNAVAPEHRTNKEVIHTIAETLSKPYFMPKIPSFILKLILGEMSVLLTQGARVSSKKIIKEDHQSRICISVQRSKISTKRHFIEITSCCKKTNLLLELSHLFQPLASLLSAVLSVCALLLSIL